MRLNQKVFKSEIAKTPAWSVHSCDNGNNFISHHSGLNEYIISIKISDCELSSTTTTFSILLISYNNTSLPIDNETNHPTTTPPNPKPHIQPPGRAQTLTSLPKTLSTPNPRINLSPRHPHLNRAQAYPPPTSELAAALESIDTPAIIPARNSASQPRSMGTFPTFTQPICRQQGRKARLRHFRRAE